MTRPRPRRSAAAFVAAAVGLASLALAAPALGQTDPGQADPGDSSTTVAPDPATSTGESTTTAVVDDPTTEVTEVTEPATDTTVSVPAAVDTPFPAALVAPVPPVEGAPDTAITDLYVTDGVTVEEPDVVVQFREPFTFAGTPYRLGVVIGDPTGTRLRTWLISNGPDNLPYGRVERFEAGAWTDLGATTVRFDNGLMIITVPIAEAPAGGAVWAEIVENDADTPSHTTPYFSRDALFGTADAGTVPSATFGRVYGIDGLTADPVELPAGGTLVSVDGQIAVTYPDPPPAEVDGQPVTAAVDNIRIAPDYDGGAIIANFVRLDRTTGEVGLYDGFSPIPIDKSGDRSWLIAAPPPREAGALILDRSAIVAALGIPDDGARIALGVSREIALEDGRLVTAEGVLANDDWLDLAPASALPAVTTTTAAPSTTTDDADETRTVRLPLLIGAVIGIVAVLLVVVVVRRRSAHRAEEADFAAAVGARPKNDRMPWGSSDGDLIVTTTHEFDALIPADATPRPAPKPTDPSVVPSAPAGSGVRILASPVAPAPTGPTPDPVPVEAAPVAPAVAGPEPVAPAPTATAVPAASGASTLGAEPRWGEAAAASPDASSPAPAAEADAAAETAAGAAAAGAEAGAGAGADQGEGEVQDEPAPPDPSRVDPTAALSALDQDMDELRRRVAGLGGS